MKRFEVTLLISGTLLLTACSAATPGTIKNAQLTPWLTLGSNTMPTSERIWHDDDLEPAILLKTSDPDASVSMTVPGQCRQKGKETCREDPDQQCSCDQGE